MNKISIRSVIARRLALPVAAVGCAVLAGCAGSGFFPPSLIPVEFQSTPQGAVARTSMGQSCTTPCSLSLPAPTDDFTVSFTLNNFQPVTIPVSITRTAGSAMSPPFTSLNPNPVIAQLQPIAPQPAPVRKKKPKKQAAAAAAQ